MAALFLYGNGSPRLKILMCILWHILFWHGEGGGGLGKCSVGKRCTAQSRSATDVVNKTKNVEAHDEI